jgi:hypothetical protein
MGRALSRATIQDLPSAFRGREERVAVRDSNRKSHGILAALTATRMGRALSRATIQDLPSAFRGREERVPERGPHELWCPGSGQACNVPSSAFTPKPSSTPEAFAVTPRFFTLLERADSSGTKLPSAFARPRANAAIALLFDTFAVGASLLHPLSTFDF